MADELIPVNILIGDRTYRIKTLPNEEGDIRATVKIINDKLLEFKTQFAGRDMQDYISMVIIWYATQMTGANNPALEKEIKTALDKIEGQLDKVLQD